jgi:hypothetical protein
VNRGVYAPQTKLLTTQCYQTDSAFEQKYFAVSAPRFVLERIRQHQRIDIGNELMHFLCCSRLASDGKQERHTFPPDIFCVLQPIGALLRAVQGRDFVEPTLNFGPEVRKVRRIPEF